MAILINLQQLYQKCIILIKHIRKMMQITNMQINVEGAASVIPLHDTHPIMSKDIITNYEKVLSYSKLELHKEISHRNVKIMENQIIHQIFTNNSPKLPHLVFLHGFGGTSMTAIRMFQHLYSFYQVHALDIFGFGYSSRGNYSDDFTFEQVRDYYINAIQEWRKALNIQKFYLVGHSFGGYLAALYAAAYPQRIIHLFLVSPAGASDNRNPEQQLTCRRKMFLSLGQKVYNWNIRPSKAMTNCFIGKKMVNSILTNRLKIPQHQQQDWKLYLKNVNSQQTSSETGFYKLFEWPLQPKMTIQQMIRNKLLTMPIDIYYGDEDWMTRHGPENLVKQKQFPNVKLTIVPHAGHQIVFDNSQFLCKSFIDRKRKE